MNILIFAIVVSLLFAGTTMQEKVNPSTVSSPGIKTEPSNCEVNVSILTGADRVAGKDGLVIIIARLGSEERRRELNRRRLHNAQTFLTEFGHRDPKTIITAEGEHANGYGRIAVYAGGKLFDTLLIGPNSDLAIGSCSFEGEDPCTFEREKKLFPCLGRGPLLK